jgi:hypothetical protein
MIAPLSTCHGGCVTAFSGTAVSGRGTANKNLVLAAMGFAVAMTVALAFAHSTQTVFYIMAAAMAFTFLVSVRRLPRGRVEVAQEVEEEPQRPGELACEPTY